MKKIIGLFSVTVLVLMLTAVAVSAEVYLEEDFSGNSTDVFSTLGDPTDTDWSRTVSDGVFHFVNNTQQTMSQVLMCEETRLGEGAVLQFDLKIDEATADGYIMFNLYRGGEGANGGRMSVTFKKEGVRAVPYGATANVTFENSEPVLGVWYTYYFKTYSSEGNSKGSIFRKVAGSDELPVLIAEAVNIDKAHKLDAQLQPYGAKGMDASIDNIKIYSDTFVVDTSLEMDGTEITALSRIDGGILDARIDMIASDVVTAEVDGVVREVYGDATPIIVVYDKDRKMIYSEVYSGSGVHMGENTFEISVDTGAFADELEGGYLGFYLWDSFGSLQPVMDAVELK